MTITETPPSSRATTRGGGDTPRIAFFSSDWCAGPSINLGGSDYWRLALPASKLYENGWDVIFARNLGEGPDGRLVVQDTEGGWRNDRDIIILQRWMGEGTSERLLRAREAGQVIINEVDDDYWNFPETHISLKPTDANINQEYNREHYRETISASSLITVSTPYLAEQLGAWGPPVRLVRNYIDCSWWATLGPGDYVGWVGGLPWRGNDLELLRDTVIPWMRERKEFFYHGGSLADMPIENRIGYERVTTRPLCGLPDYPKLWEPIHISLCPMEDTPFNRAKSWLKGLESATRKVPFIASRHDEYAELGMGRIVTKPEDWVAHLEELQDPAVYQSDVANNYERARELDISLHWHKWAEVFQEAVQKV